MNILIDCVYICQTGGKTLIDLLIKRLNEDVGASKFHFLIDHRLKNENYYKFDNVEIKFLKAKENVRLKFYQSNYTFFDKILCMANVPPPIKVDSIVYTYFHNVILFDKLPRSMFPFKERINFFFKSIYIKNKKRNTNFWITQTINSKNLLINNLNLNTDNIFVLPFYENSILKNLDSFEKENSFFYPSMGASHKNHVRLLKAWSNLHSNQIINSVLHLTVEKSNNKICEYIQSLQKKGIPIINHGIITKSEVDNIYCKCKYVIYPSLGESFGLVLIEAINNKKILIAPNLPYVDEIVISNYRFNPLKVSSIEDVLKNVLEGKGYKESKIITNNKMKDLIKLLKS
jgi:hypothetical protein